MQLNARNAIWIWVAILFVLASAWIHNQVKVEMASGWTPTADQLGNISVGSESPPFSAMDLQGRDVSLSEFRGRKVVVLDFWAMWCGPCLVAMPKLQELHEKFEGGDVEILAVNLGEEPDRIRQFLERKQYTFRVVPDQDQSIGNQFGIRAIPSLVVVGRHGLVEWIQVGSSPTARDKLEAVLEGLTGGSGSAAAGSL